MQQKITPNLWFDDNAKEAADFYIDAFPNSQLGTIVYYPNSKEEGLADFQLDMAGKELSVEFDLAGYHFLGINAGPEFKFTPAISFMINFDPAQDENAKDNLDKLWAKLSDGGEELMPLDKYPFSEHYGWIKDKFGLTWQLILTNPEGEPRPFIIPSLMFNQDNTNHAEEAINFYLSVFKDGKAGNLSPYPEDTGPAKKGSLAYGEFMIHDQWFVVMDAGTDHAFTFNEAVSLSVSCQDQAEIDYLWEKLSAVPEAEQCGWLKDKYGLSWQIVPANMDELMQRPNAYAKMMQMHKLVIDEF